MPNRVLDQVVDGLCRFYEWRGRYQEGEAMCRMAAENLETLASGDGPVLSAVEVLRVWAKILTWQGTFSHRLGRTELGSQLLKRCLVLLDEPELANQDTRAETAFALLKLGGIVIESDREEATRMYEQSLLLYRALSHRWGTANALALLGDAAGHLGACSEAKQLGEESLAIRQALGDSRGIADSLWLLGATALHQGHLEEAERLAREVNAICQEIGDRASIGDGLGILGATLARCGKFAEARTLGRERVAISNDLGDRGELAWSNLGLGYTEAHLGRYEQARALLQMGLTLARELGYRRVMGYSLHWLGCVALTEETYEEAQQLFQESVTVYQEIGQLEDLGWALSGLGIAEHRLGNSHQAQQSLYEALRTATEIRAFLPLMFALPAMALLLADQGEMGRAVELYALASRYGYVANSRWFKDVAGHHINTIATTLPSDVVTAVQERGKTRDLWETAAELLAELEGE